MAKRTEERITLEYNEARAVYHEAAPTVPEAELRKLSNEVKTLQQELSDFIAHGANPCPVCETNPVGIHQPHHYEVGCVGCTPANRSIGATPEIAVERWNNGEYIPKRYEA